MKGPSCASPDFFPSCFQTCKEIYHDLHESGAGGSCLDGLVVNVPCDVFLRRPGLIQSFLRWIAKFGPLIGEGLVLSFPMDESTETSAMAIAILAAIPWSSLREPSFPIEIDNMTLSYDVVLALQHCTPAADLISRLTARFPSRFGSAVFEKWERPMARLRSISLRAAFLNERTEVFNISGLSALPSLTELRLSLDSGGQTRSLHVRGLAACTGLRTLFIRDSGRVDGVPEHKLSVPRGLERLELINLEPVSDARVVESLTRLREMRWECSRKGSYGFPPLPPNLERLTVMAWEGQELVTEPQLGIAPSRLKEVELLFGVAALPLMHLEDGDMTVVLPQWVSNLSGLEELRLAPDRGCMALSSSPRWQLRLKGKRGAAIMGCGGVLCVVTHPLHVPPSSRRRARLVPPAGAQARVRRAAKPPLKNRSCAGPARGGPRRGRPRPP